MSTNVRLLRFLWANRAWSLLAPPLTILGTAVHEGAHALAAWLGGGQITEAQILPRLIPGGGILFGSVGHTASRTPDSLILLAPCIVWSLIVGAATTALEGGTPGRGRRLLAMVFFVLPSLDLSLSFAGLFQRAPSTDLYRAMHDHRLLGAALWAALATWLLSAGWQVFRAAWGPQLTRTELSALYGLLLAMPWIPL